MKILRETYIAPIYIHKGDTLNVSYTSVDNTVMLTSMDIEKDYVCDKVIIFENDKFVDTVNVIGVVLGEKLK